MWEHLASSLSGNPITQTFHYYIGKGSNGKSLLTETLLPNVFGDYLSAPNISLITEEMPTNGSANSQLVELKGIRYAIMQEPNKGKTLKEGIMKLISGGDNIKARSLYKDNITFKSQTSLCVCANNYLQINSQDEGTWRRIRAIPFLVSYIDNPNKNNKYESKKNPELFDRVKEIDFREAFMSLLIKTFFETNGKIKECEIVNNISKKYRNNEDLISQFVDNIISEIQENEIGYNIQILKQSDIIHHFKIFKELNGDNRKYKNTEVFEFINNKYPHCIEYMGKNNTKFQWKNLKIDENE
jgi:P4 family phage/plasmid primase-like protien